MDWASLDIEWNSHYNTLDRDDCCDLLFNWASGKES